MDRIKAAKRKQNKGDPSQIKEVVFDDEARREYLTGFRKRNLAKKEAKVLRAKQRQKVERLEFRKQRRKEIAERASRNHAEVERAYGGKLSDNDDGDDGEHDFPKEPLDPMEYENEEQLTTVTVVEDFEVDQFGGHAVAVPTKSSSRASSPSSSRQASEPADTQGTRTNSHIQLRPESFRPDKSGPSAVAAIQTKSKSSSSAKLKRPYESKAARTASKMKQKARRMEKMDEGKARRKTTHAGSKGRKKGGGAKSKGNPKKRTK